MYPRATYLAWAIANGGKCRFDLATSGIQNGCDLLDDSKLTPHDANGWSAIGNAIARANDVPELEAVATLGTAHALWLAYASVLSPGYEILIERPTYEPLLGAATGIGLVIKRFERLANKGFALDPEIVARAVTPKTRAVVVSNLHNPSGVRSTRETLLAIASIAAGVGAQVIVDEVYAPFDDFCDAAGIWKGTARKLAPNVIALGSLTKCYGLGAHRIGWLLAAPDVIERAHAVLLASCGMLPLCQANLGVRAFAVLPELAARSRHRLAERRAAVAAWVASRSDLEWVAPSTGLFGFVRVKKSGNVRLAIERGMRELDVAVVPGEFFEVPDGFRLAWSLDEALIPEAVERLGRVIDSI